MALSTVDGLIHQTSPIQLVTFGPGSSMNKCEFVIREFATTDRGKDQYIKIEAWGPEADTVAALPQYSKVSCEVALGGNFGKPGIDQNTGMPMEPRCYIKLKLKTIFVAGQQQQTQYQQPQQTQQAPQQQYQQPAQQQAPQQQAPPRQLQNVVPVQPQQQQAPPFPQQGQQAPQQQQVQQQQPPPNTFEPPAMPQFGNNAPEDDIPF